MVRLDAYCMFEVTLSEMEIYIHNPIHTHTINTRQGHCCPSVVLLQLNFQVFSDPSQCVLSNPGVNTKGSRNPTNCFVTNQKKIEGLF